MFGWFKVASANNIDIDSPLGVSVFSKAVSIIKQADLQYSRLLWEFEGGELAVDVDPTALKEKKDGTKELPKLNERLFRGVDLGKDDNYNVFSPALRDASLLAGLNQLLMRVEDTCSLARGTLSDTNQEARTATELRIVRQRTFATIADNQAALERCLRDVIRAMDKYASHYNLAPEGEYDVSFEWDDSIITDSAQQLGERLELMAQGILGKAEFRQWYLGETEAQAKKAIQSIQEEAAAQTVEALLSGIAGSQPPAGA
jgi:A118 family predicted phage portal protein